MSSRGPRRPPVPSAPCRFYPRWRNSLWNITPFNRAMLKFVVCKAFSMGDTGCLRHLTLLASSRDAQRQKFITSHYGLHLRCHQRWSWRDCRWESIGVMIHNEYRFPGHKNAIMWLAIAPGGPYVRKHKTPQPPLVHSQFGPSLAESLAKNVRHLRWTKCRQAEAPRIIEEVAQRRWQNQEDLESRCREYYLGSRFWPVMES